MVALADATAQAPHPPKFCTRHCCGTKPFIIELAFTRHLAGSPTLGFIRTIKQLSNCLTSSDVLRDGCKTGHILDGTICYYRNKYPREMTVLLKQTNDMQVKSLLIFCHKPALPYFMDYLHLPERGTVASIMILYYVSFFFFWRVTALCGIAGVCNFIITVYRA